MHKSFASRNPTWNALRQIQQLEQQPRESRCRHKKGYSKKIYRNKMHSKKMYRKILYDKNKSAMMFPSMKQKCLTEYGKKCQTQYGQQ